MRGSGGAGQPYHLIDAVRRNGARDLTIVSDNGGNGDTGTRIAGLARAHERELCQALDESEHAHFADLLSRIAGQQGLTPGVGPGYRQIGRPAKRQH